MKYDMQETNWVTGNRERRIENDRCVAGFWFLRSKRSTIPGRERTLDACVAPWGSRYAPTTDCAI
jgi:hypothetical protein